MTMKTITVTYPKVLELVKLLPPEQQAQICEALIESRWGSLTQFTIDNEEHARLAAWKRNKNWDEMDDETRIDFVDELVHEDRLCY